MEEILKKALMRIEDNNIKDNSKSLMTDAKSVLTKCENCKKYNELKKEFEEYKRNTIKYVEKTRVFLDQQKKGRPVKNIDVKKINYLRNIEKMSYKEIAKKIGVSESTVIRRYKNQ